MSLNLKLCSTMDKGKSPLHPKEFTPNSFSLPPFSPLDDLFPSFPLPPIKEHEVSEFHDFPLRDTSHLRAQSEFGSIDSDKHGNADGSKGDGLTNSPVSMLFDMGNSSSALQGVEVGLEKMNLGDGSVVNGAGKKGNTHNRWKSMDGSVEVAWKGAHMEVFLPKRSKKPTANVDELMLTDPKKARRIMSNRKSAAKAKEKRLRYVAELEKKHKELKAKTMELKLRIALIKKETAALEAENQELKLESETMEEEVQHQDEILAALMEQRRKLRNMLAKRFPNGVPPEMNFQPSALTNQMLSPGAHAMPPMLPSPPQPPQQLQTPQETMLDQQQRHILKRIEEELMNEDTGNPAPPPNQSGGNAYGNPPGPPPSM